jgi:hypothetical protein
MIVSDGRMNEKLERIWKEMVMVLMSYYPGWHLLQELKKTTNSTIKVGVVSRFRPAVKLMNLTRSKIE